MVNAVTKSGTNNLHGDLFWNFRYPTLNALDPQTKANTVNQQNQFGGSIGTPIIKDKLFFFGTYDGFRKVNPITYASTDLGGSLADITSTLDGYACPESLADSSICTNAKDFITTEVVGSFPRSLKQDVFLGKLDYQFTPSNHVSAVFNWQNWAEPNGYVTRPTVFNGGLSQNGTGGTHERFFIVNWNSTVSSNKVNEFRFQWGRDFEFDSTNSPGPSVTLSNMFAYGQFIALPRGAFPDEHRLQFADNFSIVKGSHLIKMGVDVNLIHELLVNLFQGDGNYRYSNRGNAFDGCPAGGNSLFCQWVDDAVGVNVGDNLTGQHWSSFTQVSDPITLVGKDDFYDNDFAAYLQDTWKVRPNLTLRKPMSHDIEFVVNYTFSKALDNGQTAGSNGTFFGTDAVLDPYNFKQDYSLSDLDQRHRFVGSFVWQPHYGQNFSNAVARQLAEGWTASAIITYATGHPYPANISTSYITPTDPNAPGNFLNPLSGDGGMTGAELSTYAGPTGGRAAWLPRNPSTLPSITVVDLRVGRTITFHEKYSLSFTAAAFHLLLRTEAAQQHPELYAAPGSCSSAPGSSSSAKINSIRQPAASRSIGTPLSFSLLLPAAFETIGRTKERFSSTGFSLCGLQGVQEKPHRLKPVLLNHSTQSAIKIFVSCGTFPLRFEAQTRRLPSEENIGKASKSG